MPTIRDVDELIGPKIAEVVRDLADLPGTDAGAIRLAERYAAAIDAAVPPAKFGEALRYIAGLVDPADDVGRRHVQKIIDALAMHATLSDLGPKLLQVLESLGATPRGRVWLKQTAKGQTGGKLAAIRAGRTGA